MSDEIVARLVLEVSQAEQSAQAVVSEVNKIQEAADEAGKATNKAGKDGAKGLEETAKSAEKTTKQTNALGDAAKKMGSALEGALSRAGINIRPLITLFTSLQGVITTNSKAMTGLAGSATLTTRAVGVTSAALRIFRAALISTGVGALVVALGALAAALFTTQRGADILTRVITPLKVLFQNLLGVAQELGFKIIDAFKNPQQAVKDLFEIVKTNIINRFKAIPILFQAIGKAISEGLTGNLSGVKDAAIDAGQAVIQFTTGFDVEQQNKALEKTANLLGKVAEQSNRLIAIEEELRNLRLKQAQEEGELTRIFQEQSLAAADVTKTLDERKKAGEDAIAAAKQLRDFQLQENALLVEKQKIQNLANDTDIAGQTELAALISERDKIEAAFIQSTRRVQSQINNAIKLERDAQEKAAQERIKLEQEVADQIAQIKAAQSQADLNEFDKRRAALNDYYDSLITAEGATAEQIKEIRQLLENELTIIDLEEQEAKLLREQQLIDGLNSMRLMGVDAEIQAVRDKYAGLRELAEGNASALLEIEQRTENEITEIKRRAAAEQRRQAAITAQSTIQSVASVLGGISQLYDEQSKDQKALALFQIGLNTASGIAGAVAAGAGVAFPFNLAAIASGIAAVLSGISQAKQALSAAPAFATGTTYLDSPTAPSGVDTVLMWGNKGEAIIPTDKNAQYPGLAAAFINGDVEGWINRYHFQDRLNNLKVAHSNVTNNEFNDINIVGGLKRLARTQEETNYLLQLMGKTNKFKRAG